MKSITILLCLLLLVGCNENKTAVDQKQPVEQEIKEDKGKEVKRKMQVEINNQNLKVQLESNTTVDAFIENLPMTIVMEELHGNEKFYYFDQSMKTNTTSIGQIKAGDIMLYGNNCLVIFYQDFTTTYRYTKIGHIENASELAKIVGTGSVRVTFTI